MKWQFAFLATIAITAGVLLIPAVPLGVPGEWTWSRHALPETLGEFLDRFVIPCGVAALLILFARWIDRRIDQIGRCALSVSIVVLAAGFFCWLWAARQAAPSPHRELRPLWILYDRFATGYFHEACFETHSQQELLAGYESRVAAGDVLHEGTHPPGLFLISWWAIQATRSSALVQRLGELGQSDVSTNLFRTLEGSAAMNRPLTPEELAALGLLALLSSGLTAVTVIPVFLLTWHVSDRRTAWRAACLCVTLPALAVFAPRSDVVYAFSASLLLTLILLAFDARSAVVSVWLAALAGVVGFLCLAVSLAHLPVIVAGGVYAARRGWWGQLSARRLATAGVIMVCAVLLCVAATALAADCNLLTVWRWNLRNHAAFYSTSPRTWWLWLMVNPIELAFAAGLPLAAVALAQLLRVARQSTNLLAPRPHGTPAQRDVLTIALAGTWCLLWLSGKNMGEAARLWCFLTPWCAVLAAIGLSGRHDMSAAATGEPQSPSDHANIWVMLLSSQFLVGTLTTGLMNGYLQL